MEGKELLAFIKKAQRRIFLSQLGEILLWYLGAGFGIGILVNGISLFAPLYGAERMALGVVLLLGVLGIFYGVYRFPGKKRTARLLDEKGLSERVSTALEQIEEDSDMAMLQRRDTLRHLSGFSLKDSFPIKKDMKKGLTLLGLMAVFTATAFLPSEARQEALRRHELQEEIKTETRKAEELKKLLDTELALKEALKAGAMESLKKEINQSVEELAGAKDRKELLKAEKRLEKKLAKALQGVSGEELTEMASALLGSYVPELSPAAVQMAKNNMAGQNSQNAQGGQSSQGSQNEQSSQEGQNGENAKGGQNGENAENGMGNGSGGRGSGTGTGYNYGSSQGMEKIDIANRSESEKITIPGREKGEDENLVGTGKDGSSQYIKGTQSQGFRGEETEYSSILGEYSRAAYDRLSEGEIPEGMETIVKNYFDGLNE